MPTGEPWDEEDLESRLCRALDIAKRALERFAADGYLDEESASNSVRPEKLIAEAAMLVYAASGARHRPRVAERLDDVVRTLLPHARSDRTLLKMAMSPSLSRDLAFPHILLTRLGQEDPHFDAFVRFCDDQRATDRRERLPAGAIEQRWLTSLRHGETSRDAWTADLDRSIVGSELDVLGGQREDAYAFTHILMYCTDFGNAPEGLSGYRAGALDVAHALLARCLDTEDYDLGAETLLAWPLTAQAWTPAASFAFSVLARLEDLVGVLPGGTTDPDRLEGLEGLERSRYALGTAYHTAFVMGLLCAVSLRPGRAPCRRIPLRAFDPAVLREIESVLDRDQGHWQQDWMVLSDQQRGTLVPLALDLAIVQKVRQRDYPSVGHLLALAYRNGVARSVLCGQAAMLLQHLSVCSEIIQQRRAYPDGPAAVQGERGGLPHGTGGAQSTS